MCFHCSQRGALQSWMNFMWEDWNLMHALHAFFPALALLFKRPSGKRGYVCQLSACKSWSLSQSTASLKCGICQFSPAVHTLCWNQTWSSADFCLPSSLISPCALGTWQAQDGTGTVLNGADWWNADLCVSASAASIHICIMSSMSNMTMESKT